MFRTVAIIGLGLMGGSLGLSLKKKRLARCVAGFARRAETRGLALELGIVDRVFERPEEAVREADVAVFCTSVGSIPELAAACRPALGPGAVMTDVGSCKRELVAQVEALFPAGPVPFIGSHPIAGSERQGIEAASDRLYADAVVALTPTRRTSPGAVERVNDLWRSLGARTLSLTPLEHDRLLARTSHLPHLMAACLAACVGRHKPDRTGLLCGNGFWDTTRIAEGDPVLWRDILRANRGAVSLELRRLIREAGRLADVLASGDLDLLEQYLRSSRDRRRALARREERTS